MVQLQNSGTRNNAEDLRGRITVPLKREDSLLDSRGYPLTPVSNTNGHLTLAETSPGGLDVFEHSIEAYPAQA